MKQWSSFWQKIRLDRLAFYSLIGAVVIIVGSYATWRIIGLFSPSDGDNAGGTTVILKVSDHSTTLTHLLPNSLTESTLPDYNNSVVDIVPFAAGSNTNYDLFRLQGQTQYK